jgi:predicted  nucleic acid-binding Zn-ribbon protein
MFSSILAEITGKLDKSFLTNIFMPTLLFSGIILYIYNFDNSEKALELWSQLPLEIQFLYICIFLFLVVFIAYLIDSNLTRLTRFYEGYWEGLPLLGDLAQVKKLYYRIKVELIHLNLRYRIEKQNILGLEIEICHLKAISKDKTKYDNFDRQLSALKSDLDKFKTKINKTESDLRWLFLSFLFSTLDDIAFRIEKEESPNGLNSSLKIIQDEIAKLANVIEKEKIASIRYEIENYRDDLNNKNKKIEKALPEIKSLITEMKPHNLLTREIMVDLTNVESIVKEQIKKLNSMISNLDLIISVFGQNANLGSGSSKEEMINTKHPPTLPRNEIPVRLKQVSEAISNTKEIEISLIKLLSTINSIKIERKGYIILSRAVQEKLNQIIKSFEEIKLEFEASNWQNFKKLNDALKKLETASLKSTECSNVEAQNKAELEEINEESNRIYENAYFYFPPYSRPKSVMPTRLGNIFKSAEMYPRLKYDADPVFLWSRIYPLIDTNFKDTINKARGSLDLMIVISFLSVLLSIIGGLLLVMKAQPSQFLFVFWGGLLLSWLAYEGALEIAITYGEIIRTTFDLYRDKLITELGLKPPDTPEKERELWKSIGLWLYRGIESKSIIYDVKAKDAKDAQKEGK